MLDLLSFAALYMIPSFLVVLTVVVTIHELGHFWAARTFGVAVDRFAIGFGRPIFARTDRSGVEWRIGWIPLGGYVRFGGDTNDASVPDAEDLEQLRQMIIERQGPEAVHRYYHFKPVWQRAIIAAAGPAANFILAFTVFCLVLLVGARFETPAVVGQVQPDSPAAAAGFVVGDLITHGNGRPIRSFEDLTVFNSIRAGNVVRYGVERGGESMVITATLVRLTRNDPLTDLPVKTGFLGVSRDPSLGDFVKTPLPQIPGEATRLLVQSIEMPIRYIGRIFSGRENGDQLSGIIGIATTSGKITERSLEAPAMGERISDLAFSLIQLTAFLSVAIGFVNLLPIPVLDGGHLLFYAYEAVARRPVGAKVQAASYRVGLALVLGLMLFATWNDLQRLQAFKFFGGLLS